MLQEQWSDLRDLGIQNLHQEEPARVEHVQEVENNPTLLTLMIAQHEWRKVLDGTKGLNTGRSILPGICDTY